jgi:4-hydroxybenzoyl-CoA thioesterase
MAFTHAIRVGFGECDPAGIVFYPRYLEMVNRVVETFFRDVVGQSYEAMMAAESGVPTVRLDVDFLSPGRLGQVIDWTLRVARIGRSSVAFDISADAGGTRLLTVKKTVVFVRGGMAATPWTDAMRERLADYAEGE